MKHITLTILKGSSSPYIVDYKRAFPKARRSPTCQFDVAVDTGIALANYPVDYFIHRDGNGFINTLEVFPPTDDNGIADNITMTITK